MKIVSFKGELISDKEYFNFLILETVNDVEIYKSVNEQIKAKQGIDLWFGFKSQNFRQAISDYAAHETESNNGMAKIMAITLDLKKTKTSLTEYCNISDKIIHDIHKTMFKFINNGKYVRVNNSGGYCSINPAELEHAKNSQTINELELHNYLTTGTVDFDMSIKKPILVIENANYVPKELIQKFNKNNQFPTADFQVITGFKLKTILFKTDDWIYFFKEGLKKGLTTIVFETTAQDTRQIKGIKDILNAIIPDGKQLSIFVKTNNTEVFDNLDFNKEKIKLNFI